MIEVIYRHGEDDFSLWQVELPEDIVETVKKGERRTAETVENLLLQMPVTDAMPEDTLFVLVRNGEEMSLYTGQAGADFVERYGHEGCSTRADLRYIADALHTKL